MSQNINPINGGKRQIVTTSNPTFGRNLSKQYQEGKNLFETPTEWVAEGRPIYNRLPAASERYFVNFGFEEDLAYVYAPPGEGIFGPNSLNVVSSTDKKFLIIKAGSIVYKNGNFSINPVIMNLELVGLYNSKYTIAYRLLYDDSPFTALYDVKEYSLSGYEMKVGSNTDDVIGWRYEPKYAFCQSESVDWRNYDNFFPNYDGEASLYWQFPKSASFSKITLRCPLGTVVTGSASLYITNCYNPDPEDDKSPDPENPYCENPEWILKEKVEVQNDSNGQYFSFSIEDPIYNTGWKVIWSDPKVSISSVRVTGTIPLFRKPAEGRTNISLVAYPQDTLPPEVINEVGKRIPVIY